MTTQLQNRIANLPVWARDYLRVLEQQNRELEARVNSLFSGQPTNTAWGSGFNKLHFLPDGAMVEFTLPHKGPRSFKVAVRIEQGRLDLNANDSLVVLPGAANHVVIQQLERSTP